MAKACATCQHTTGSINRCNTAPAPVFRSSLILTACAGKFGKLVIYVQKGKTTCHVEMDLRGHPVGIVEA